jgi:SecD/SecF fusion protein
MIVLVAIFIFGGPSIRGFVFALMVGIGFGTYSSIFVASAITYDMHRLRQKKLGLPENE